MSMSFLSYCIDYYSYKMFRIDLSCKNNDNFNDYGHGVKQRKPFNQRVVKGKSRESKNTFHSNEKSGYDPDIMSEMNNETECYNARFIKYKQNPRNREKARWSKGGDNMARINCEYAMRPHCYSYSGIIKWDSSCNIGANKGRAWWRDAHQYAYLKYSLCTKGVDGITGWCNFGGKWMKRKLSKHERRNGKKETQDQINDALYTDNATILAIEYSVTANSDPVFRSVWEERDWDEWKRNVKEEEDWCYDEFYDIPDYGPSDEWSNDQHHNYTQW